MNTSEEKSDLEAEVLNDNKEEEINYISESNKEKETEDIPNIYKFGWSNYAEITNGRFAMLGFLAIILIELFSQKSFLNWAGII